MGMIPGYNTNGFAHHRLEDALAILAELGYGSVALTVDQHVLNPFAPDLPGRTARLQKLLAQHNLRVVVETGARFLLDPRRKHQPTLLDPDEGQRQQRLHFLKLAVDIAADLGADAVSLWSGTPLEPAPAASLLERLRSGLLTLSDHAERRQVRLAFEPEPGMFIDTLARFAELQARVDHPRLGLTVDIGHLHCLGEVPIADQLRRWQKWLWNVHIEDMRHGVHDHLLFGEGEIDFPPVLAALQELKYAGALHVELSRHSHDAVNVARLALAFLRQAGLPYSSGSA